jgi:hypothetical protein
LIWTFSGSIFPYHTGPSISIHVTIIHCEGGVRDGSSGLKTGSSQIITFGLLLYGLALKAVSLPLGHSEGGISPYWSLFSGDGGLW